MLLVKKEDLLIQRLKRIMCITLPVPFCLKAHYTFIRRFPPAK
jgi:hypothetical protein